ncbi:hypothetical protein [Streptomyces sp. NPDC015125]|uniref:hypothetical protein n=1 Tax=Streptomyces sp. NPDC015125 TaxID=3364938 RepID=UPI0036F96661
MAAIAVGAGIVPQKTTCCLGTSLERRSAGPVWDDDLWECPLCGCQLQTSLTDSVPRGQRIVTSISTANCSRTHAD